MFKYFTDMLQILTNQYECQPSPSWNRALKASCCVRDWLLAEGLWGRLAGRASSEEKAGRIRIAVEGLGDCGAQGNSCLLTV